MRAVRLRPIPLLAMLALALVLTPFYGPLRSFIAVIAGSTIVYVGLRYLHSVVSTPEAPEVTDVSEYGLKYVCTMCGLELKVEKAAQDRAPRHCGEKMELVRTGGKPPLKPL